ncbi:MAG: hypothetical protein U0T82_13790 [Bacteroidales bacterium]
MNKTLRLILLLFIVACSRKEDVVTGTYDKYFCGDSLTTDLVFYPVEEYADYYLPDTPALKLVFITTEVFPCIDFGITTREFTIEDEMIIRFENIIRPDFCYTAIGSAYTLIDLPERINKLVLINGKSVDVFQLSTTREFVHLSPLNESFAHAQYEKTFRYPENSFAYICGTNKDNTHLCTDFLNILLDSTEVSEIEFVGEGRIPYPESSSGNWVNHKSRFFSYSQESDFENAGNLLRNFTIKNLSPNDGVTISLVSWNNRKYMSWMMDGR